MGDDQARFRSYDEFERAMFPRAYRERQRQMTPAERIAASALRAFRRALGREPVRTMSRMGDEQRSTEELRRVAERADHGGRPWYWGGKYPQRISRVGDMVLIADCFEGPDHPSTKAEFIATFDPPTALRLLDELDHAYALARSMADKCARAEAALAEKRPDSPPEEDKQR